MQHIGTLETVCRYPVKSMAGEELAEAFVGFAGMMGDRAWAFVREPGPKGFPWHTGREQASLVLHRPRYREGAAATALPRDAEASFGMAPGVAPVFPAGAAAFAVDVATPEGRTLPVDSPELKAEIEARAGGRVGLRFSERALADCRPVSLFGNATAEALVLRPGLMSGTSLPVAAAGALLVAASPAGPGEHGCDLGARAAAGRAARAGGALPAR